MTTKEAGCKEEEEKVVYFFNFGNVAQSIDSVYQIESRRQVPSDAVDGCGGAGEERFSFLVKPLICQLSCLQQLQHTLKNSHFIVQLV